MDLDQLIHKQDRLNLMIGILCPIIPTRNSVTFFAGTDAWHHNEFSVQAEYKRREMNKLMNDRITDSKMVQNSSSKADYQLYNALEGFSFDLPPLSKILPVKITPFLILIFQGLMIFYFMRLAAAKYTRYE